MRSNRQTARRPTSRPLPRPGSSATQHRPNPGHRSSPPRRVAQHVLAFHRPGISGHRHHRYAGQQTGHHTDDGVERGRGPQRDGRHACELSGNGARSSSQLRPADRLARRRSAPRRDHRTGRRAMAGDGSRFTHSNDHFGIRVRSGKLSAMFDNPWDPRTRTDLTANERVALHFMSDCMHGDDLSLVDRYVAEGYIQHTPGIGQGREACATTCTRSRGSGRGGASGGRSNCSPAATS